MKFFNRKSMALSVAAVMLAAIPLSACKPPEDHGETDEFVVTLDYNDETSRPRKVYVDKEGSIQEPAEPVRTGYEISNWTTAKENGTAVTFPYKPTADVTLYAQWNAAVYDVTFDFNFAGSTPLKKQIEYNAPVEAPKDEEIPVNEGFNFRQWETKAEGGDAVTFPYTVKKDITFYAAWVGEDVKKFTVSYDANYDDAGVISSVEWVEGDAAIASKDAPKPGTRKGYNFLGWSLSPDATSADVTFPYTPTDNTTMYAVWEKATYLVRFRANYTGAPKAIISDDRYEYGYSLAEPAAPTRSQDGFTFEFDGWYDAAVGGQKQTFPITITGTTNLYAHWLAPLTETTKFDAEFTPFNPKYEFLGYSNSTFGVGAIQPDIPSAYSAKYPLLDNAHTAIEPHYVTYLFKPGATLTFNIYSDKAVSGAALYLCLSNEFTQILTYTPEGPYGYQINVNGTALDYGSITVDGGENLGGGMYKGSEFKEYRVPVTIDLKEGLNVIQLITNNTTPCGGTTQATAPIVDYIRIEASGAKLSWRPEYDNLYRTA